MNKRFVYAFSVIVLANLAAMAVGLEGRWAGILESPGSNGAIRLHITTNPAFADSTLTVNVYGTETITPIRGVTMDGEAITFVSELSKAPAKFAGRVHGDRLEGTFEVTAGDRVARGRWSVRRFDDSGLTKEPPPIVSQGRNELPIPTGDYQIGRRTFYWTDEKRLESITDDPSDHRRMLVQIWYPAVKSNAAAAPYIPDLEELHAKSSNLPTLRTIRTHAGTDAPVARSKTRFPLIVFSPGLGSAIHRYTAIIENLASNGYVVAAVNPGYDAGAFKFRGETIDYLSRIWDQRVSAEWTAEKRKAFFDDRRSGWAMDMSFVLDRLTQLGAKDPLAGKIDFENIGAVGHSFGGQAVSIACAEDRRFKACANLDGLAQGNAFLPNSKGENLTQPFMFFSRTPVVNDYELKLMGISRGEYDSRERRRMLELWRPSLKTRLGTLRQGTYFVVIRGGWHESFSDGPLLEASPKDETLADRLRRAETINKYILAFFDTFLKKNRSRLLESHDRSHADVIVELLKPSSSP